MSSPAFAQAEDFYASITAPDTSGFPAVSFLLDVRAPGGDFIENLDKSQVTVLEDDQPVEIQAMKVVQPGLDLMIAVNAGSALSFKDGEGTSRYDQMIEALQYWAASAPAQPADRYSLLVNQGTSAANLSTPSELLDGFVAYQSDFHGVTEGMESLSAALDMAVQVSPTPGRARAILFITPVPEGDTLTALNNLHDRAVKSGARLFVWMVASADTGGSSGAQALMSLAAETQGQFMIFSGKETLPDLEDYLRPLRSLYSIQYQTALRGQGEHTLAARINLSGSDVVSPAQTFSLNVQNPNPMFVSPPSTITRTSPADSQDPLVNLTPATAPLTILVEFPDGIQRGLQASRLYVDGKLAAENTAAPYDQFTWELSPYTASARHTLRAEVVDQFGMTGASIEIPVDVSVVVPQQNIWTRLVHSQWLVGLGSLAVLTISLGGGFYLVHRRRNKKPRSPVSPRRTQPVSVKTEPLPAVQPSLPRSRPWPTKPVTGPAQAFLTPLGTNFEPLTEKAIPLLGFEITVGQDPTLATCVLDDPAVEGLHARLRSLRSEDGSVWTISDEGSVAGTWVNYEPVFKDGARLEHGDIVHIGRLAFRYNETNPIRIRKPNSQIFDERL